MWKGCAGEPCHLKIKVCMQPHVSIISIMLYSENSYKARLSNSYKPMGSEQGFQFLAKSGIGISKPWAMTRCVNWAVSLYMRLLRFNSYVPTELSKLHTGHILFKYCIYIEIFKVLKYVCKTKMYSVVKSKH